jgi:microcystin-dependent protein
MEGTMSEIRIFSGNFAPKFWAFCNGQIMSIQSNTALFSLLGTTYGGNGVTTFALPDLRGRTGVGAGQGNGLAPYVLGEVDGTPTVTLIQSTMASHTHTTQVTQPATSGTGTATVQSVLGGGQSAPGGNYLSNDSTGVTKPYAHLTAGTPTPMGANALTASNLVLPPTTVTAISLTGSNLPHNNVMPSIAINYIICLQGIFPSRN